MINSRGKRVVREAVFLSTFVFVRVEDKNLNEIRFRSDVYKMLSEPGKSAPYAIPDTKFDNFSEREFEEKVATSIILRLMVVSLFSMIPSVLIGKFLQSMPISQRKIRSMPCWRTLIVRLTSTWIYIDNTLFLFSINYAVMEKLKEIDTLPAEFGWSDLGSWGCFRTLLPQDEAGNAKVGKDIRLYERTAGSCSQWKLSGRPRLGLLYCSLEEWTAACLLIERETED